MLATELPTSLTDQELIATVLQLAHNDRENVVQLLVNLGELDGRKLYLEAAKPSLFAYCVEILMMSEGTTFKRIAAARVARRFPVVLEMIAAGEMHLSGLALLAKHLTEGNHREVLARARKKSKRDIERLQAELCPKPDTASTIRRLPSSKKHARHGSKPTESSPESPESPELPATPESEQHSQQLQFTPPRPSPPASMTATAAERYRVNFTAGELFHNNLREAQALLKNQIPDGDIAEIMDRALRLLLVEVKKKKRGSSSRRRSNTESTESTPNPRKEKRSGQEARALPKAKSDPRKEGPVERSRAIPKEVLRAVYERDGGRCTFTNESGTRCTAACGLEFHHDVPFGRGGEHEEENIRLLCKPHNLHQARKDYGAEMIEQQMTKSRHHHKSQPGSSSAGGCSERLPRGR